MYWKVALNFACSNHSELEKSLSTAFYSVNYTGLNETLNIFISILSEIR